ncbi:hypothetical protein JCM11641_006586 [Rhodosporidiobolus odoratus]
MTGATATPVRSSALTAAAEEKPLTTADLDDQPKSLHQKLEGYELWKDMGEPKYIVAPMVDQSELAWRILSRLHGANLCYTPMFHAALFATQKSYQPEAFDLSPDSLEGVAPYDRPLIVQFCANDKDQWLDAARKLEGRCDAVDLNLGCPQGIAKRGHYGAFLMEEWDLIRSMISHLHTHLSTPVIAKIRVFPSLAKTLQYAAHVFSSGAQLLAVHGRTREAKGQLAGFASWSKIKAVVDLVSPKVPILANGGVPGAAEVEPCLEETGAYGILSAEGNLYNPMIFSPANAAEGRAYLEKLPDTMKAAIKACEGELDPAVAWDRDQAAYAPATYIAAQYLAIVTTLPSTKTATSAIKAHLYKLFRPVWAAGRHLEMREKLGRCGGGGGTYREKVETFVVWLQLFRDLLKNDLADGSLPSGSNRPLTHPDVVTLYNGIIPYSHCQPYLRVTKPAEPTDEDKLKAVDGDSKRKREVGENQVIDALDPKRLKPSPASPSPSHAHPLDSTAPAPSAKPTPVPCPNANAAEHPCGNAAAARCEHSLCKACCAALRSPTASVPAEGETAPPGSTVTCEFHEEKDRKAKEAQEERKRAKKERKMRGEQKGRENVLRNREGREKRKMDAAAETGVKEQGVEADGEKKGEV